MKPTLAAVGLLGPVVLIAFSSPQLRGAEANPKTTLQQARTASKGHRLPEAVAAYEKVAADPSSDAAKYKPDALYELLLLRVSPDPAVRDLPRGAAAIQALRAYPAHPRAQEIAAIGELLQEADRRAAEEKRVGEERLVQATTKLTAATARARDLDAQLTAAKSAPVTTATTRQPDDSGKLRQEAAALRAENRNLRDQLAKTQAELQKKDEALKKVAGSLMKPR
jgi:hypothetical protein